ncbi:putative coproporphyrinogen III oxidase [Actinobacillus pleuropneumoniae serovar 6 str. Femo]|nr:putative coproporphyrinogen III oxidase [Actinobacillus pleuropneumoniae serovar 2 str. 4226]EFL80279.1 putative coproporphyrinogen III oxidase [Actinobacillus pleuropneumoniae serovar 6 str. Femo]
MLKLRKQNAQNKALLEQVEQVKKARFERIIDSIDVITRAMLSEQCDFSEGVLRLKPLLDVLAKPLSQYSAMWELYQVVEDMPILDERKALKRNERMKQDLHRQSKEVELEEQIKAECHQLLIDIAQLKLTL